MDGGPRGPGCNLPAVEDEVLSTVDNMAEVGHPIFKATAAGIWAFIPGHDFVIDSAAPASEWDVLATPIAYPLVWTV